MSKKIAFFILFFLVFAYLLHAENQQLTEGEKLDAFFEQQWEWALKEFPLMATYQGDPRYNDRLGDFSLAAVSRLQQHAHEVLEELKSFDRSKLSDADKLNYDLFLLNIKQNTEGQQFPGYLRPVNQLGGLHQMLPQLAVYTPLRNEKDYRDYLSRLNQIPEAFEQTIEVMKEGLARKVTPARIAIRDVRDQIKAHIVENAEDSLFYMPFKRFSPAVSEAAQEELRAAAKVTISEGVVPAYRKLHQFWTNEYYPNTVEEVGLSALPDGEAWYRYLIKAHTTTNISPDEIHEIGLKEVKRIREEMDKVIRDSGFEGTFEEFIHFLRTDPQFYFTKPEELVTAYRDICKRIDPELPKLFGKLPRLTYGVREIPTFSAPSQTTAYCSPGSLQAGRPGWYYVNTYKLETRPKWEMEALSIHEAVPGHHFQISLAQELENVPNFRRFGGYTAYVEGWALYCESLGDVMGFYKDPYSKFGQLTYEIWRAIRLVVDTGIHYKGWDRQRAIDYFKRNSSKQEHDITVEIDRYIVNPGQALAYKIGELEIKRLRKMAEEELGEDFDIREFHDLLLGNGALPLSVLERQIREYVTAKKAGASNPADGT